MSTRITLEQSDITTLAFDAIVNAANAALRDGSGVNGAIQRAGGPSILQECRQWVEKNGLLPAGQAMITTGGLLPARYVIHAVGPVFQDDDPSMPVLLADAYRNALRVALENQLKTVAFPNISTGVFGYPKAQACVIAVKAVRDFVNAHAGLEEVRFVCFDEENYAFYQLELARSGLV